MGTPAQNVVRRDVMGPDVADVPGRAKTEISLIQPSQLRVLLARKHANVT